jgi:hypothetical protein
MRRASAYRVYLTKNSEYHVRGLVCFGVRDRRSGGWVEAHWALAQKLASAFPDATGHMRTVDLPVVGESLCFIVEGEQRNTSAILGVEERAHLEIDMSLGRTPSQDLRRPRTSAARETR